MKGTFRLRMVGTFLVFGFAVATSLSIILSPRQHLGTKLLSLVVLLLSLFFLLQRDTFLPFLGPSAFPVGLFKQDVAPEGANIKKTIPISAKDGDRVIYWGAMPGDTVIATPWDAYKSFENAGIATVKNGEVTMRFHCPTRYKVPYGKTLDRHVHYRVCCQITGMLGRVETTSVNC